MLFLQKINSSENRLEAPVPSFIPYACHFDACTLLTKNGQLLQTFKISGLSEKLGITEGNDIRNKVRLALLDNIQSDKFSLWFHTVRRKANLDPEGEYQDMFSSLAHEAWCLKNYWRDKFVNELYVTILIDTDSFKISNFIDFLQSFSFSIQKKRHMKLLEESYLELNQEAEKCLVALADYGAKKLGIAIDEKGAYSELLQFFDKIIHLREARNALPLKDLSHYLATHKIAFGKDAFEVRDHANNKFFGGILSIKEYHELPTEAMDKILQLPQQLIVTEAVQFVPAKRALASFEYQKYIFEISGETEYGKYCGLDDLFANNKNRPTDYAHHQINIAVIAEDFQQLESEIERIAKNLFNFGLIAIREDLHLEDCYWGQLPGNFKFLKRQAFIQAPLMGGFTCLHNSTMGDYKSHWGAAITLFRTVTGGPYFFNFHDKTSGHTAIIGQEYEKSSTLVNFLLSQAGKLSPHIFILDYACRAKLFVKAMGGDYEILENNSTHQLNPLLLPDNDINRKFLSKWLSLLFYKFDPATPLTSAQNEQINKCMEKIFSLAIDDRRLQNILDQISDAEILQRLTSFYGSGRYARIFNTSAAPSDNKITGLDLSFLTAEKEELMLPLLGYLFHLFNNKLDGKPAIIVLNNLWHILRHPYFSTYLEQWLDYLTTHNAIAIFIGEINEKTAQDQYLIELLQKRFVTKIFLPCQMPEIYQKTLNLTSEELQKIKSLKALSQEFMYKQGNKNISCELNLAGLDFMVGILGNQSDAEKFINEIIQKNNKDSPMDWLPIFYENYISDV
jgi:type IV secretion system protein VirB4